MISSASKMSMLGFLKGARENHATCDCFLKHGTANGSTAGFCSGTKGRGVLGAALLNAGTGCSTSGKIGGGEEGTGGLLDAGTGCSTLGGIRGGDKVTGAASSVTVCKASQNCSTDAKRFAAFRDIAR